MGLRTFLKQFSQMWLPPATGSWITSLPGSAHDYALDGAYGLTSSVLMACINWLMRTWPEASLVVRERQRTGDEREIVSDHRLVTLVNRPNPYYSGEALWMASVWSWCVFGNTYWRIVATRGGEPRELWWVAPWLIEPIADERTRAFIGYYRYTPPGTGRLEEIPVEQIIHVRHGLDPRNPRYGLSPILSVMREISTDEEAGTWIWTLLRNMAVPGMIITPDGDAASLTAEDAEALKRYIQSRFTGEHRGEPMAFELPVKVQKIGFSPSEMDLTPARNTAEERVAAVLGIPAAVVGFGTGLESTKVGATMEQMVRLAWNNGIIPPQRIMAGELQQSLLPRFETDVDRFRVGWDYTHVSALQENESERLARYDMGVKGGWIKVSEARQAAGLQVQPEDEVYLRPMSVQAVDPDEQLPPELPVTPPRRALPERTDNGQGEREGEREEETEEAARGDSRSLETKQGGPGSLEELLHTLIGRHAGRMDNIPPELLRLAARQWRQEQRLAPAFERQVLAVLRRYGDSAAVAARELLTTKQTLQDMVNASIILERMPMASIQVELQAVYEALYAEMFRLTQELLMDSTGLELTDPGRIQAHLSEFARQRTGLLDLSRASRTSILQSLEEARTQGLTEDAMIDLIRDSVPRGRWLSVETRARILVRSESRFSSNIATAQAAQQAGVDRVLILDARLGVSDEPCNERNGWIVSPQEAALLAGVEHVNGTLAALPLAPTMSVAGGATS